MSSSVPAGVAWSRVPEPRRPPGETVLLLVEDNVVNQKVYVAVLAQLGYHVEVAGNGVQALERMARTQYAAVLMDGRMPVMDGYQATAELRRREGAQLHTPVIAMTAANSAADRERCLAAGMDDFLAKPVSAERLADTLALWLTGEGRPAGDLQPRWTPT